ncbi:uncharacterized protein LOC116337197 [Contarinia nasturtii]|uniref:uncharacterized protein LOC116337197 n=1 Tax=Contarinia nasturtii TaxID=265458 RepID=UPI0012D40ABC|nr:uncharacterized protein LOC116337197 [Contarinia nasturtii]
MSKIQFLFLFICAFSVLFLSVCAKSFNGLEGYRNESRLLSENDLDFDMLLFIQSWPTVACVKKMDGNTDFECLSPPKNETWIIHGLRPYKLYGSGPLLCGNSSSFDLDSLKPFMDELLLNWFNLNKASSSEQLWRHEWLKYGTCSKKLPDLDREAKYFGQGLKWFQQYNAKDLLSKANIKPDTPYKFIDFYDALKNKLKINPKIVCHRKPDTGEQYLSEIGICFGKTLELVDCMQSENLTSNTTVMTDEIFTNCNYKQPVLYASTLPTSSNRLENHRNESHLLSGNEFDILMFMQQWPTGYCINNNECIPPPDNETWGIHGIWPNNLDGSHPSFCSDSSSFDIESLKPFMDQLKQSWFNLMSGSSEEIFWRHEWLKHGTCAVSLPELNTEAKYFGQALKWFQKYHIKNLLSQANIKPGTDYNIIDIHNALKNQLNIKAVIRCYWNKDNSKQYLSEIGICFSKTLELVDCMQSDNLTSNTTVMTDEIFTNCNDKQPVLYAKEV